MRMPFLFLSSQINKWGEGKIPCHSKPSPSEFPWLIVALVLQNKASIKGLKLQWDISTCLYDIPNRRLNGSGGQWEQVFASCCPFGYNGFMAANSKQGCYCLFTFYQPPLFIYVDFDWWRHFKKGGVEEYFNCLVSNSCESIVHTGRVFLKRNVNLHIFPFAFLTEIWEVEHKQCFRYISDHHRWCISHCNQPGKSVLFFLMKKVLRLLQSLFYIFTSYSSAN